MRLCQSSRSDNRRSGDQQRLWDRGEAAIGECKLKKNLYCKSLYYITVIYYALLYNYILI